jgi:hypothetical protein
MGTASSQPSSNVLETPSPTIVELSTTETDSTSSVTNEKVNKQNDKANQLTGVDLVNYKCQKKYKAYTRCVSNYYKSDFLAGKNLSQEEQCQDVFEAWQTCYVRGMRKEVWGKRNEPPKEGSMLDELDDER